MSRSADLAAVRRARCISARAGSVTRSGGRESSCCNCWIRKVRCAVSADCAAARNSATSTSAIGLAACGFLRPGWSEEPASDPPLLRKRGRDCGNRAAAVDEAVMESPDRAWTLPRGWRRWACALHSVLGEVGLPDRWSVTSNGGTCRRPARNGVSAALGSARTPMRTGERA